MTKKLRKVSAPDYGDEEINRLALADITIGQMTSEERLRFLIWIRAKYNGEWPVSD